MQSLVLHEDLCSLKYPLLNGWLKYSKKRFVCQNNFNIPTSKMLFMCKTDFICIYIFLLLLIEVNMKVTVTFYLFCIYFRLYENYNILWPLETVVSLRKIVYICKNFLVLSSIMLFVHYIVKLFVQPVFFLFRTVNSYINFVSPQKC